MAKKFETSGKPNAEKEKQRNAKAENQAADHGSNNINDLKERVAAIEKYLGFDT
jgi:hypothetical protein